LQLLWLDLELDLAEVFYFEEDDAVPFDRALNMVDLWLLRYNPLGARLAATESIINRLSIDDRILD
jgi:hypothetical protein